MLGPSNRRSHTLTFTALYIFHEDEMLRIPLLAQLTFTKLISGMILEGYCMNME